MEENLEIYFCEICNESVPAQSLATRDALEVNGKVIGPCCVAAVQRSPGQTARGGASASSLTALGVFLIAAIAGATIFLESRLSEQVSLLEGKIEEVETNVANKGSSRIGDFEKALDRTMQRGELQPLSNRLGGIETKVGAVEDRIGNRIDTIHKRLEGMDESNRRILNGQTGIRSDVKEIETEILRLEREVASAAARPQPIVREAAVSSPKDAGAGEEDAGRKTPRLPAALAAEVARLKDGDAGNRFEAVDTLIQSRNQAVVEALVGMLKDEDAFVRRLTAEGLASFKSVAAVEGLLVSLADSESIVRSTAHASLKKLTGQAIGFDPDASARARGLAQRRWKDWWEGAKAKF